MRRYITLPLYLPAALMASPAMAQSSGDALFNGLILGSCTVVVGAPGTIAADGDGDQLSSENPGGAQATADVTATTLGFRVFVDTPTGFSLAPAGGDANVAYSATYSLTGATILTDILAGLGSLLLPGAPTVSIDATADKMSGVFPEGSYQLPATVRCAVL